MKLLLIIVICFIFLSTGSALHESLTFDEIVHMQEGHNHLVNHAFAIDTNNPPLVRELAAIPLVFGLPTVYARLAIVLLGAILLVLVYKVGGIWSAFLLALEPTFLAHSHYVTLDVGAAFFIFLAYLVFLDFLKNQSLRNAIFLGIASGFSFASRIQSLIFLPISFILIARTKIRLKSILLIALISVFIVWFTYFFVKDVIIAPRQDPNRLSSKILQTNNLFLKNLVLIAMHQPVPLGNYLATVKNSFLRSTQQVKHNWYDLPFNFLLKTPIPFLIFIILGARSKKNFQFLVPTAVIIIISSVSPQQPWVRYVIPAFPFLAIIAGTAIVEIKGNYQKVGVVLILFWYAGGTLVQFPHFISYANELAGSRDKRFEKLIDSNLDWGQSLPDLADYLQRVQPKSVSFSYFGRDNADAYGLVSNRPYGSYKFEEICAFHEISYSGTGNRIVAISTTNWYQCGFSTQPQFGKDKIKSVVADTILIF